MSDILDLFMEMPAILMHVDSRKPLCNKGGAQKPTPPPPAMAPYEEVQGGADTSFSKMAVQRKGLRSTILSQPGLTTAVESNLPAGTLGQQPVALGSRAANMTAAVAAPPQRAQTRAQTALNKVMAKENPFGKVQ